MKCMNSFRAQRVWGLRPHRGVKPRKRGSFTPLAGALRFGPAGERPPPRRRRRMVWQANHPFSTGERMPRKDPERGGSTTASISGVGIGSTKPCTSSGLRFQAAGGASSCRSASMSSRTGHAQTAAGDSRRVRWISTTCWARKSMTSRAFALTLADGSASSPRSRSVSSCARIVIVFERISGEPVHTRIRSFSKSGSKTATSVC